MDWSTFWTYVAQGLIVALLVFFLSAVVADVIRGIRGGQ
jgi:hypothetical protein